MTQYSSRARELAAQLREKADRNLAAQRADRSASDRSERRETARREQTGTRQQSQR